MIGTLTHWLNSSSWSLVRGNPSRRITGVSSESCSSFLTRCVTTSFKQQVTSSTKVTLISSCVCTLVYRLNAVVIASCKFRRITRRLSFHCCSAVPMDLTACQHRLLTFWLTAIYCFVRSMFANFACFCSFCSYLMLVLIS